MTDSLKILTIGNSFTDSLTAYFQQVVESAGCQLLFDRANHGGCELRRHWEYISNEERDSVYRMYQGFKYKMREILAKEPWDYVTIQQASHDSWRPETFHPFADNIAAYVKQYAPGAKLAVQQTWSYRADDHRIMAPGTEVPYFDSMLPTGAWNIDQTEMYNRLTANYTELAQTLNALVIPTGYAVQLARKNDPVQYKRPDPGLLRDLRWPDLPSQAGDVVGSSYWVKNAQTGEMTLGADTIHLNRRGQYMQACVWFALLYGHKTDEVTFVPNDIGNSDAAFLRKMAQQAVDEFPQVCK